MLRQEMARPPTKAGDSAVAARSSRDITAMYVVRSIQSIGQLLGLSLRESDAA